MALEIAHPKMHEIGEAMSVLYSAFRKDFSHIFQTHFEYGRKLFVNFYIKFMKEPDLEDILVVKLSDKIVATVLFDFTDPNWKELPLYLLKMSLHFFRSFNNVGIRQAFKITLGMYWFLFEDFNRNSCYIKLLGVHPAYQNLKIGTKILQLLEKMTRAHHLKSMSLDVTFEDLPARHLYKKQGFKETRHFQNAFLKYLNGIEGVFSMEKKLDY